MQGQKLTTTVCCEHKRLPARITQVQTAHGAFQTPSFMPVGTKAAVNHASPKELLALGSEIILGGNTYHMLLSPGMEVIKNSGGMHNFMQWHGPMLTDSGGFQLFSLSKNSDLCVIDDTGARFRHPQTGNIIRMRPEDSIKTQKIIGADIIMAFDECTPEKGGRAAALQALNRTERWLKQSVLEHQANVNTPYGYHQALFGIVQGGSFRDLRERSAEFVVNSGVDGIAIGGEVIGFDMAKTSEIIDWVLPFLPADKSRYTMGVGAKPQDLIAGVAAGIDMFDCVAPTRNARHGALYHGLTKLKDDWVSYEPVDGVERILIKKSIYAQDDRPILAGCDCYACQNFSRAQMHHLFKNDAIVYSQLACIHNIRVMHNTCQVMRQAISNHQKSTYGS